MDKDILFESQFWDYEDMNLCDGDPPLFDMNNNLTSRLVQHLFAFNDSYTVVHRWLCALLCTVGVVVNSAHIFVLTRKPMRIYAINSILSVMAICDVITMASYLIYIVRFKILDNDEQVVGYPYVWLVFLMYHVVASIALHTVSLYLSVIMAYIRWTALDRLDSKWVKSRSVGHIFFFTSLLVALVSVPTLMVHKIVSVEEEVHLPWNATEITTLYTVTLDENVLMDGCMLFKMNLWLTGICFKAFPCILLLWFTVALMLKLCEMSHKRRQLRGETLAKKKKKLAVDKTTVMLIIMLTVFLCTELPQGALVILNAIYTNDVYYYVYVNLGELLDLLSLVNCNVGFILYCFMSSKYRSTFKTVFLARRSSRPMNSYQNIQSFKALLN